MTALAPRDIERVDGAFRIHLQADGAPMSPWFEITLE
jgi:hypothetical protein